MYDVATFTLNVRFTHTDTIPSWLGYASQAAFLATLRDVDPTLSATVHDSYTMKPFTTSSLEPAPFTRLQEVSPHKVYTLRWTTLHADLTRITLNALIPRVLRQGLTMHDQPLRVESVDTQSARYAELLTINPVPRRLTLRFDSPTGFKQTHPRQKSEGVPMPLPVPERVFSSLIDRWQLFSDVPLHPDLRAWIRENVGVWQHRIQTRHIHAERANQGQYAGFVGQVTYELVERTSPFAQQVEALARFATFSGVGIRTTTGMGQTQLVTERR